MNQNVNQSAVVEEISPEEAAGVMGGRIVTKTITGSRRHMLSVVKRIITNKTILRVLKLKNGVYTVRYKAEIKRPKSTVSQTNWRPARNWSFS